MLYNQDYPEDFPGPEEFNKENTDYILSNLGFDQFVDELSRITGNKYSREKLYRKIPLTSLYRYNKSLCDVFIRLSDDKFVKVQNAEACYSRLDLDTYRQRGIKHLYTTDDDFKKFMRWRVLHNKRGQPLKTALHQKFTQLLMSKESKQLMNHMVKSTSKHLDQS